jgi:hypothetical protein
VTSCAAFLVCDTSGSFVPPCCHPLRCIEWLRFTTNTNRTLTIGKSTTKSANSTTFRPPQPGGFLSAVKGHILPLNPTTTSAPQGEQSSNGGSSGTKPPLLPPIKSLIRPPGSPPSELLSSPQTTEPLIAATTVPSGNGNAAANGPKAALSWSLLALQLVWSSCSAPRQLEVALVDQETKVWLQDTEKLLKSDPKEAKKKVGEYQIVKVRTPHLWPEWMMSLSVQVPGLQGLQNALMAPLTLPAGLVMATAMVSHFETRLTRAMLFLNWNAPHPPLCGTRRSRISV